MSCLFISGMEYVQKSAGYDTRTMGGKSSVDRRADDVQGRSTNARGSTGFGLLDDFITCSFRAQPPTSLYFSQTWSLICLWFSILALCSFSCVIPWALSLDLDGARLPCRSLRSWQLSLPTLRCFLRLVSPRKPEPRENLRSLVTAVYPLSNFF